MKEDDKVQINFGKVMLNGSDFKTNTNTKEEPIKTPPPSIEVYTWELTDEHVQAFKKYILKKYGENIFRCMGCEYCLIELDDEFRFKDIKCKQGVGKLSMISKTDCLIKKGG